MTGESTKSADQTMITAEEGDSEQTEQVPSNRQFWIGLGRAFAGALKKRLGLKIASEKVEGRGRVYRSAH